MEEAEDACNLAAVQQQLGPILLGLVVRHVELVHVEVAVGQGHGLFDYVGHACVQIHESPHSAVMFQIVVTNLKHRSPVASAVNFACSAPKYLYECYPQSRHM